MNSVRFVYVRLCVDGIITQKRTDEFHYKFSAIRHRKELTNFWAHFDDELMECVMCQDNVIILAFRCDFILFLLLPSYIIGFTVYNDYLYVYMRCHI